MSTAFSNPSVMTLPVARLIFDAAIPRFDMNLNGGGVHVPYLQSDGTWKTAPLEDNPFAAAKTFEVLHDTALKYSQYAASLEPHDPERYASLRGPNWLGASGTAKYWVGFPQKLAGEQIHLEMERRYHCFAGRGAWLSENIQFSVERDKIRAGVNINYNDTLSSWRLWQAQAYQIGSSVLEQSAHSFCFIKLDIESNSCPSEWDDIADLQLTAENLEPSFSKPVFAYRLPSISREAPPPFTAHISWRQDGRPRFPAEILKYFSARWRKIKQVRGRNLMLEGETKRSF